MKKLVLALMLAVSLIFSGVALAQEVVEPTPAPNFDFNFFGISGDAFYPLSGDRKGKLLDGASLKVIKIKGDLASVNVVAADMLSNRDVLVGLSGSINIPILVEDVLKGEWIAKAINPSIGIAALADFNAEDSEFLGIEGLAVDPAIHLQVIKYEF